MIVTLDEVKEYLHVDYADEDDLLSQLIYTAQKICMDVARITDAELFESENDNAKIAVLYTVAYLHEHREEANHHDLIMTLRSLLFGIRQEGF